MLHTGYILGTGLSYHLHPDNRFFSHAPPSKFFVAASLCTQLVKWACNSLAKGHLGTQIILNSRAHDLGGGPKITVLLGVRPWRGRGEYFCQVKLQLLEHTHTTIYNKTFIHEDFAK